MCASPREAKSRKSCIVHSAAANWLKVRAITWCGLVSCYVCMPVSHGGSGWSHTSLVCVCIYIHVCGCSSAAALAAPCVLACKMWALPWKQQEVTGHNCSLVDWWFMSMQWVHLDARIQQRYMKAFSWKFWPILSRNWRRLLSNELVYICSES